MERRMEAYRDWEGSTDCMVLDGIWEDGAFNPGTWEKVEVTADSGAADMVGPENAIKSKATQENSASKNGKYYVAANGGKIENKGETKLVGVDDTGVPMKMTMQVAKVHIYGPTGTTTAKSHIILNFVYEFVAEKRVYQDSSNST